MVAVVLLLRSKTITLVAAILNFEEMKKQIETLFFYVIFYKQKKIIELH